MTDQDPQARFEAAASAAKALTRQPSNEDLLALYALYKQATAGDVAGARPGALDFVARAKHDAWAARKGTLPAAAMREYIALVDRLRQP